MKFRQLLDERQPDSEPTVLPSRSSVGLAEHLKNMRKKRGVDALARVLHDEYRPYRFPNQLRDTLCLHLG
jgi:hypothetical protein